MRLKAGTLTAALAALLTTAVPTAAAAPHAAPQVSALSAAGAQDYGCTIGSGSQRGDLRHCGGYFKSSTDGTNLRWQVYLPDPAKWGPGPYPTVLDYSGYEPGTTFFDGLLNTFVDQGYAVAGINIRGTGCSGGRFDYFEPVEWKDGYDGIEFLAHQTWSNGHLAMVGKSYPGISPLYVAATDPPNLDAIVPGSFFADLYRDVAFPGGIENTVFAGLFSLASQPANQFDQQSGGIEAGDQTCIKDQAQRPRNVPHNPFVTATGHPFDSAIYHQRSNIYFASQVHVPVFAELAWQDEEVGANGVDYLTKLPPTTPWRAALLYGDHGGYYGAPVLAQIFRFLSYYLRQQVPAGDPCTGSGDGSYSAALACYQGEPRVTVEGDVDGNQQPGYTLQFPSWPVTQNADRWYLHSGGTLSPSAPTTNESPTTYAYTPGAGTNSYGTLKGLYGKIPADDDFWQTQPPAGTVAQFTTAPFSQNTLYTGTGSLDLWLSSTAPDTDLEVMVTELRPDGQGGWVEQYVQKGWLRASHRKLDPSQSTPLFPYQTHRASDVRPLIPGQPTQMRVEVFPFSQVIRAGERLRITVEAPALAPELWGFAALPAPAQNTIYTDPAHPSSIALPLVSGTDLSNLPAEKSCTAAGDRNIANQPCRTATGVPSS
jgi:predicted acyl esterase